MKGSKYLSELVDVNTFQIKKLNIIKADTGSGKTYFALNHIPSLVTDSLHTVVYLIDTINGQDQILKHYNAISATWSWAKDIGSVDVWYSHNDKIVVMTYAKFAILCNKYPYFHTSFDYIICDELHSLFKFAKIPPIPNWHTIAIYGLRNAINNDRTKVIALSATPDIIKQQIGTEWQEIPIDQEQLIHYEVDQEVLYSNLDTLLSGLDCADIGLCYTMHIRKMIEIEAKAKALGLSPVCIWSTSNKDHIMTEEQLAVRDSILNEFTIPEGYNLLIINSSSETSIKIKSHVDYVIVNSLDKDTQIQVRGRVNSDLNYLYLYSNDKCQPIELPDEFLDVKLFTEDKKNLCDYIDLKNDYRKRYKWNTIKDILINNGYDIKEGRENDKRYVIISLPQ